MKRYIQALILVLAALTSVSARQLTRLNLPNREQLSSQRVLSVIQDSEGTMWYATEGGGVCRDDGRQFSVFRNDAAHPDLLGSNNVCCLAETGPYILIGTFHGAYLLDRRDFSILRVMEVDDNRIDDALVTHSGEVFLTSNRKIYHFDSSMQLLHIYPSRWNGADVYVSTLFEDSCHRIWATQWSGGLLRLEGDAFREQTWNFRSQPTALAEATGGRLWIGTVGRGIVLYDPSDGSIITQPETGGAVCLDLQSSPDGSRLWMITMNSLSLFKASDSLTSIPLTSLLTDSTMVLHRLSLDLEGHLLVAGSQPGPFVVCADTIRRWFDGVIYQDSVGWTFREREGLLMYCADAGRRVQFGFGRMVPYLSRRKDGGIWVSDGSALYSCTQDSVRREATVAERPVAICDDLKRGVWYSTGHDIHHLSIVTNSDSSVLTLADVSALAVTPDNTLWLATIYGQLYKYSHGKLVSDDYASNEYGDAVTYLDTDSSGHLLIVSDLYSRLYDPERRTLSQQSRESLSTYCIQLPTTAPESRWSQPPTGTIIERLPDWLTSWWMWCIYIFLFLAFILLLVYNWVLRRQRKRFLSLIVPSVSSPDTSTSDVAITMSEDPFLNSAITDVERHLSDDTYGVEQLSANLCMSRMTFYRRIQSATGQKPTEFIRTIRLRRAASMLSDGQFTATEVSYATGFSSVSYFSRCFRTMYGVPPTLYGKHITAADRVPIDMPSAR